LRVFLLGAICHVPPSSSEGGKAFQAFSPPSGVPADVTNCFFPAPPPPTPNQPPPNHTHSTTQNQPHNPQQPPNHPTPPHPPPQKTTNPHLFPTGRDCCVVSEVYLRALFLSPPLNLRFSNNFSSPPSSYDLTILALFGWTRYEIPDYEIPQDLVKAEWGTRL